MKVEITLTWSKIMAFIIIILSFILDLKTKSGGTVFMFAIPFAVVLITGKQMIDKTKEVKSNVDEEN